ncbi:hypothetical protein LZ32DRAFT_687289 [Colletotrichum eremochloae]|nr:hypothetical protein LZ32DRAFT_687289 [Colletotrichum eremochloae]
MSRQRPIRWQLIKRKFNNSGTPTTLKKTVFKTPTSNTSSASKVKKAAGHIGAQATEGKIAVKSEEEDIFDEDDEEVGTPTKATRIKLEDVTI